jgi:protein involved in polysaccharide export with SLBB domain
MKMRLSAYLALLLLAASPAAFSQIPVGDDSSNLQQSSSPNCTDVFLPAGEGCDQGQSPLAREGSGGVSTALSGSQSEPSLPRGGAASAPPRPQGGTTSAPSEISTLGGRYAATVPERASPPDASTEFQQFVAATTGQMLPIFGVSLFHNVPSTFSPSDLAPVTPEYVIGPDDELRVRIWGQITYAGNLRVDRSGNIYLPQAGSVHVAGLPFSALDQHLRAAIAKMYRNFDLSVDIGRIRSMQIYVTGQARRPGVYTVSSLSSLVDTLFASGGPSPQGSLRHIRLNRDGKTIDDFDLYALLIQGDKSHDVRLLPEDVLNIPPAGPQVAITGSIRVPAIYELRGGQTIGDLLEAAGGTTAMSSNTRISLERLGQDQTRHAMEFAMDAGGLAAPLADGDILRIFSVLPAYQKTVTLRGHVANPGRFAFRPSMRLSDLIPDRDSLVSRDYWWKRSRLGLPGPTFEPAPEISASTYGGAPIHGSIASAESPSAAGVLRQPRRNEVRISAPEIDWDYAVIERLDPETLRTSLISFDLGKLVLNRDASQDLALQPGDTVTIFSQGDLRVPIERQTKYVDLEGEFAHSGIYSVQPGETLRDLVRRAGGLTQKAYLYGSEFTRESTRLLQQQRLDEYVRNASAEVQRGTQALAVSGTSSPNSMSDVAASQVAGQQLIARLGQIRATGRIVLRFQAGSSSLDDVPPIALEDGDKFLVPYAPSTINVVGAVYDQNSFLFAPGRSVGHYLQLAGGANRNADWRHAFVIRADGSVVSRAGTNNLSVWTDSFKHVRLSPGDSIVVPDKMLRPSAMRAFSDWTQVFAQLALGAAAIHTF